MVVLKIIILILNIPVIFFSIHFGIFGLFPYFKKPKKVVKKEIYHRFLILIAARNEELVIAELIESLKKQNYPKDKYDIYVIPNNCTDNTKEVSLKSGAKILELKHEVKTKGMALNYAFQEFQKEKKFDTYVIFDADNVVHPDFLKEMNLMMQKGYQVVQGFRDTKNLYHSWLSASYGLSYYLQNLFIYEPRTRLKASANLNGTGYVVTKDVIEKTKFQATTLTEDIELTVVCAINNIKIGYAKKALFYDEQVEDFLPSIKQRQRWNLGFIQIFKKYYKDLFKSILKTKNLHAVDCLYLTLGPLIQILILITTLLNFLLIKNIWLLLFSGLISYLGTLAFSLFLIIYYKKNLWKSLKGILLFPLFAVSGILASLLAFVKPDYHWAEIKHKRKIKIENILKEN